MVACSSLAGSISRCRGRWSSDVQHGRGHALIFGQHFGWLVFDWRWVVFAFEAAEHGVEPRPGDSQYRCPIFMVDIRPCRGSGHHASQAGVSVLDYKPGGVSTILTTLAPIARMCAVNAEYGLAITEISCRITENVLSAAMAHTTPSSTVTSRAAGRNTEDAALHWVSDIAGATATMLAAAEG